MADQKLIDEVRKYIDKYYEPVKDDIKMDKEMNYKIPEEESRREGFGERDGKRKRFVRRSTTRRI